MFKVIVAGSRHFNDYKRMKKDLDYLLSRKAREETIEIVSGGCRGADACGERYAREMGYSLVVFPADWDKFGKIAGPIRNHHMAEYADALVAYLAPGSRGTSSMIEEARRAGLRVIVRQI